MPDAQGSSVPIIVVDDEPAIQRLIELDLRKEGFPVVKCATGAELYEALATCDPAAVLLDVRLPDEDGHTILRRIREMRPNLPVIMMTAHGSVDSAVDAMKIGAFDFLLKPIDRTRLHVSLKNAVTMWQLTRRLDQIEKVRRREFEGILGESDEMQAIYTIIENVARSDATVFVLGESGVGKELIAKAIHARSPRAPGPFVPINCAAIPSNLLESELFGHEKGAFTGADRLRVGCCEEADKGTLFLDEICEMDFNVQAKLLRFLQERTFKRVGGGKEIRVNVRIIAATNKNPETEKNEGRFREDLYFRLNVVCIEVPPLRKRRADIPLLSRFFLQRFARENRKEFSDFSPEAFSRLCAYDWPGNVRELQHVIEGAVVLNIGKRVTEAHLPPHVRSATGIDVPLPPSASSAVPPGEWPSDGSGGSATKEVLEILPFREVEKRVIAQALRGCGGNVADAARRLKLGQATLYRKIKKYNLTF